VVHFVILVRDTWGSGGSFQGVDSGDRHCVERYGGRSLRYTTCNGALRLNSLGTNGKGCGYNGGDGSHMSILVKWNGGGREVMERREGRREESGADRGRVEGGGKGRKVRRVGEMRAEEMGRREGEEKKNVEQERGEWKGKGRGGGRGSGTEEGRKWSQEQFKTYPAVDFH